MALFHSTRAFDATDEFIPAALKSLQDQFEAKGFRFRVKSESLHRTVVEVQRGGLLHQAVGLRNGLEITFTRREGSTVVEVRDCLIENQLIGPAIIFRYLPQLRIPVAITDGIGLIMQANLPSQAMDAIEGAYAMQTGEHRVYCPYCGAPISREDGVCDACGKSIAAEVAL